jgi:hypothetical protein
VIGVLHWQQWVVIVLWTWRLAVHAVKHGEPQKPGKYNFGIAVVGLLIAFILLFTGGFFTGGVRL